MTSQCKIKKKKKEMNVFLFSSILEDS